APGEVVVVVDEIDFPGAEQVDDLARHPFAARVRIAACEVHEMPVVVADRRIQIEQNLALRRVLTPTLALPDRQAARRDRVAESSTPEVHGDPYGVALVHEDVDIVVPATHGAKLRACLVA